MIPTTAGRKKLTGKTTTRETPSGVDISDPPSTEESIPAPPVEPAPEFQSRTLPLFSDPIDPGLYLQAQTNQ